METGEYYNIISKELNQIIEEYKFNNYKNQIAARKMSVDFTRTYSESYLWDRALYLSTNGCNLLHSGTDLKTAIISLKIAAEIFEDLSEVSEVYDRDYCLILSALCFDISGYQANAVCLIRKTDNYLLTTELEVELDLDNYIIAQIRRILLKQIYDARAKINNDVSEDIGLKIFNKAIASWFETILNGTENNYSKEVNESYLYFLKEGNIYLSQLLFLIRARVRTYSERSIWENLKVVKDISINTIWNKYIKLQTYDIYDRDKIKESEKRLSKFEFWISQLRALDAGILSTGDSYVIQMPTSAGKTFIAELAILNALIEEPDKKCIYVAPFRALTNEKEVELADYLSKLGYSVSSLSGSYELDEFQEMILEDTNVLIATPEKIDLLLRVNPEYFESISLMVVDEGHIVGEISSRASLLEFLIIRLKIQVTSLRTIFISAVMPPENADEYSTWLNGNAGRVVRSKLFPDSAVDETWEPTKKWIGRFDWVGNNGTITYKDINTENEDTRIKSNAFVPSIIKIKQYGNTYPRKSNKGDTCASLAFELSKDGNCLVFCSQPRYTKSVGNSLLSILEKLPEETTPLVLRANRNKESYFFAKKWFGEESHVTRCIERGIGIHYGDMPEAVRRAVETDYSDGKLRILIATNTVGQGLNFPIKYIIIHSTIISTEVDENKNLTVNKVSNRDFWNLVGRAGRAGKETEGQVIFVINSHTDNISYEEYSEKTNIEPAFSMFFNVLNALVEKRINANLYEQYMSSLAEPYLLSLLAEEVIGDNNAESAIEQVLNNSLFKVQADKRDIDLTPIRNSFSRIMASIEKEVPEDLLRIFSETGFGVKSNLAIRNFISAKNELLFIVDTDDYLWLLALIFELFHNGEIEEVTSYKLDKITGGPKDYLPIANGWITGSEIENLIVNWADISDKPEHLHILLSEGFYFRYAWGISAFLTILKHLLNVEEMPDGIKNLSSFIKFGLNNSTACLARSIGIKNRDIALRLSDISGNLSGRNFIKWVANLSNEDIDGFNFNTYDAQNILTTAFKLSPNKFDGTPIRFTFWVKGVFFNEERRVASLNLTDGDILNYYREPNNNFDPFAIKITDLWPDDLGYVPREFSKLISVEIDINQIDYLVEVLEVLPQENYNDIYISMIRK